MGRRFLQTPSGLISTDSVAGVEPAGDGFLWTSAYPEELEFWTWWRVNDMELKGTSPSTAWQGERSCHRPRQSMSSTKLLQPLPESWPRRGLNWSAGPCKVTPSSCHHCSRTSAPHYSLLLLIAANCTAEILKTSFFF